MIRLLIELSLRHRGTVIALACVLVLQGLFVASRSRLDVFPEFAPPQVVVHTEAPGLSCEEVEALVTLPVENGVNGVGGLESIRSQSIQGLSVVTAIFEERVDVFRARQMVGERLVQIAGDLPDGVGAPTLAPLTSSTSLVLAVGLTSTERSLMELRTLADWTLRPRLLAVPGVANVVEFGGEVRQLQVQLRPEALVARGLSMDEVLVAARQSTLVTGAGFVETDAQRIPIRTEGQALTASELGEVVVARKDGAAVRLADVAHVLEASAPKIGDAAIDGVPGVLLLVWSQYGSNTLEVTAALERALAELTPALASGAVTVHPRLFRPASFIETSLRNILGSMLYGGALVILVLWLFLFNLRTALISITAIPSSLLIAVLVLDALGATLNTMTLGGLAIAIGEVVDDAIIDVENIFRRLRENRRSGAGRSAFRVVLDASIEVRSAVVHATFIVALVFLPVLMMSGVNGKLFAPLAAAYILATLASLGAALTLTPALSLVLLRNAPEPREPWLLGWLKRSHRACLERLGARPVLTMSLPLLLCALAAATLPFFGGEFLPEFQEGHFIVQMSAVSGTSARESLRIGQRVSRALLALEEDVESVSLQVGRAELGEDTAGTSFSELIVALKPPGDEEEAEEVRARINGVLGGFPGLKFSVLPFLEERIEETISGTRAEVAVRVYGDDLDLLDRKAGEIEEALQRVPGSADVVYRVPREPQMVVRLRPERLTQLGLRPVEVLQAVHTAFQGRAVAEVHQRSRVVEVVVILEEPARQDPELIGALLVQGASGQRARLGDVADVFLSSGRDVVLHESARRYQEVTCNVRGRDLASFVAEAKGRVASEVALPPGVYTVFAGAGEAQALAQRELLVHSCIAGAAILLLLGLTFHRPRNVLLVLFNIPFALVGGVLAVFFMGGALSVGSLVGFVTLFGITMRNSIMMISHLEHLVGVEGRSWSLETVLQGASDRLVPVLMTATTAAFGLLPIALGAGAAGREIEGPMAIVILGGLVSSTTLNLLILPTLAYRFGRFEPIREE